MYGRFAFHLFWATFLVVVFYISLSASWMVWAKMDFVYPVLHDHAGIGDNIDTYGPKNRIKRYFHQTVREERLALFSGIVSGIQNSGEGLGELTYHTARGKSIPLLTQDELLHLNDVAVLYDKFKFLFYVSVPVILMLGLARYRWHIPKPSKRCLFFYLMVPLIVGALVYFIGAEKLFYQLHTLLFPVEHKWYFYYEESLMSMMMKAPYLFAYIAAMLLFLSLVFSFILVKLYFCFLQRDSVCDVSRQGK